MNEREIVKAVSKILSKKSEAKVAVDTVFQKIAESLKDNERVLITNFGRFNVKKMKPRIGRNPKTGEPVSIPDKKRISFKASRYLLDRIK